MQQPFGHTLKFSLSFSRSWLSFGPGWAALAGALATGYPEANLTTFLKLLSLWLLVDPLLGTLWDLLVRQGLGRSIREAQLPPSPLRSFFLPYARPESPAGRLEIWLGRYRLWWRERYWPEFGTEFVTFGLGLGLALLLGLFLGLPVFGLTVLAIILTWWAGSSPPNPDAAGGGRWQGLVQFFLSWFLGSLLWPALSWPGLVLAFCYGSTYLGGLRMWGNHRQADRLFFIGQIAAILVLLGLGLLPGAAVLSLLLMAQGLIRTKFQKPAHFLPKVQPYLVFSLLVAGLSTGSL